MRRRTEKRIEKRIEKTGKGRKLLCLVLSLLFLLTVLSGCGKDGSERSDLNYHLAASPVTVDPQLVTDTTAGNVVSFFVSTLYKYDKDRKLVPGCAESYEVSEDKLTVTFHLKKNLKWSDGSALTAEDFVYAFRRLADPDTKSGSVYLITDCCMVNNADKVSEGTLPPSELGVSAPDHDTFVIKLQKPCPFITALVASPTLGPCSQSFVQSCGDDYCTSADTILSSGAFKVDRYVPLATQIHMSKNENYYDADQVTLEGINIQIITDAQQAMMCYEAGEMDVIRVNGATVELAEGDPELTVFSQASAAFLDMNFGSDSPLQNRNLRLALAKSIDRDSIVKNVVRAGAQSLTRINPPGYYYEASGKDIAEDPDKYKDLTSYDPAKAKEYWEQGLKEIGKSSVELSLCCYSNAQSLCEALKQEMEKALPGLTINIVVWSTKDWLQHGTEGEGYDLIYGGWAVDYTDPTSFYGRYSAEQAQGNKYMNPDFEKVYQELVLAEGQERDELLEKAEDILMNDMAQIPIYTNGLDVLIKPNVKNLMVAPTGVQVVCEGLEKEVK